MTWSEGTSQLIGLEQSSRIYIHLTISSYVSNESLSDSFSQTRPIEKSIYKRFPRFPIYYKSEQTFRETTERNKSPNRITPLLSIKDKILFFIPSI